LLSYWFFDGLARMGPRCYPVFGSKLSTDCSLAPGAATVSGMSGHTVRAVSRARPVQLSLEFDDRCCNIIERRYLAEDHRRHVLVVTGGAFPHRGRRRQRIRAWRGLGEVQVGTVEEYAGVADALGDKRAVTVDMQTSARKRR